ncbi:MAG: inorganic phosphate transporter [Rhodospirillales bacterium]|nr:inorganic phosphate transporter [Rhodospirillales bacterium]
MEIAVLLFLSSGLFLGWSLGANDAANVFGTAVGTRMVHFTTAAIVCSIFVVLGAVFSGAGAAHTLGKLGSVNAIGGSFVAALSAGLSVYWMTRLGITVSTSQAIVGAIIGWNLFSDSITDSSALIKILITWVACPILAGLIAAPLYIMTRLYLGWAKFHLLRLDAYTRAALIGAGAFGAYSLGANNIANVMGVFVPVSPFTDINLAGLMTLTSIQQLFLLGALAIAVGVFTYSKKVMLTVGDGLMSLSPVAAWVVVIAHSIVLFLFTSESLEHLLASNGLPTIPLVPVSSSQAVVGAVVGIGILKGARNIQWRTLGNIGVGWVMTPLISATVCFVTLFFVQNVFNQEVYRNVSYSLSPASMEKVISMGAPAERLQALQGMEFNSAVAFRDALRKVGVLTDDQISKTLYYAENRMIVIDPGKFVRLDREWLSKGQFEGLTAVSGRRFEHTWEVSEALAAAAPDWRILEQTMLNKKHNKEIQEKLDYIYLMFSLEE